MELAAPLLVKGDIFLDPGILFMIEPRDPELFREVRQESAVRDLLSDALPVVAGQDDEGVRPRGIDQFADESIQGAPSPIVGRSAPRCRVESGGDLAGFVDLPEMNEQEPGRLVSAGAEIPEEPASPARGRIRILVPMDVFFESPPDPEHREKRAGDLGMGMIAAARQDLGQGGQCGVHLDAQEAGDAMGRAVASGEKRSERGRGDGIFDEHARESHGPPGEVIDPRCPAGAVRTEHAVGTQTVDDDHQDIGFC